MTRTFKIALLLAAGFGVGEISVSANGSSAPAAASSSMRAMTPEERAVEA